MRTRRCNHCFKFSPIRDWEWGCPECGYSHVTGDIVRISEFPGVLVMDDIKPYRSMADGSIIESRSKHREHLRKHNSFEIGNEVKYLTPKPVYDVSPQKRKELIRAQVMQWSHDDFKKVLNREIQHIKWNSNK